MAAPADAKAWEEAATLNPFSDEFEDYLRGGLAARLKKTALILFLINTAIPTATCLLFPPSWPAVCASIALMAVASAFTLYFPLRGPLKERACGLYKEGKELGKAEKSGSFSSSLSSCLWLIFSPSYRMGRADLLNGKCAQGDEVEQPSFS